MLLFAETNNGDQGFLFKKVMKNFVWNNIAMFLKELCIIC